MLNYAVMTAAMVPASLVDNGFNDSLKEWTGKSTPAAFNGLQKVVIDAGHGGKDPGGMGENSYEKHIALSIAQLLAIGIRTNFPDVEVIMTRSDDTFIPLYERAAIANDAGADLFISIHANIMPGGTTTYGTETFVMGQHVAKHNLEVAKRENASILLEDNVEKNYGYDPNSDQGHIMMSMFQHAFLERSILFAGLVENEFSEAGRRSRGVKQAGFVVLKETTMPAVLVETGFMSNPKEESYLLSDAGQRKLANSLLRAFGKYYEAVTGKEGPVVNSAPKPLAAVAGSPASTPKPTQAYVAPATAVFTPRKTVPAPTLTNRTSVFGREIDLAPTAPPAARQREWTAKGVDESPLVYKPTSPANSYPEPVPSTTPPVSTPPVNEMTSSVNQYDQLVRRQVAEGRVAPPNRVVPGSRYAPIAYGTPVMAPDSTKPTKGYVFNEAKKRKGPPAPKGTNLEQVPDEQLLYGVQVIATKRELNLDEPQWQRLPYPILKIEEGGYNKYQARGIRTAAEAAAAKERIKAAGFFDAMVVVYLDGKRLSPSSVRYLLGR